MILRRYHIRAGATTTAGGVVRVSSDYRKLNGVPLARDGDPVDCPACGAQGVIKCVTPRLIERFKGKEFALSDDLCICGCNPPPKLIADQQSVCQVIAVASDDSAETSMIGGARDKAAARAGNAAKPAASHVESATNGDMRPLRFVVRETGKPHANSPYRLALNGGKVVQGTTDSKGDTRPLTQEERSTLRATMVGRP